MGKKSQTSVEEALELLGHKVKDAVTGFEGVVETVGFDLYGCVQAIVKPTVKDKKKRNELPDGAWFDVKRLKKVGARPVMSQPDFAVVPGGGEKPPPASRPLR